MDLAEPLPARARLRARRTARARAAPTRALFLAFAPLKPDPRFRVLAREMSGRRIAFARELGAHDQYSLRSIASGHYLRGELDQAIAALEEALARGGPLQAELEQLAARLRRERDERRAGDGN